MPIYLLKLNIILFYLTYIRFAKHPNFLNDKISMFYVIYMLFMSI
jgi:hypothetical protein